MKAFGDVHVLDRGARSHCKFTGKGFPRVCRVLRREAQNEGTRTIPLDISICTRGRLHTLGTQPGHGQLSAKGGEWMAPP